MIYDNQLIKEINSELAARRKAAESRAEYYADILGKNAGYAAAEKNITRRNSTFPKQDSTVTKRRKKKPRRI